MTRAKTNGRLETLRDVHTAYLKTSPGLASARKLRYRINCWERFASITLPIRAEHVRQFRDGALAAKLSPATINDTVADILCLLRGTKQRVPQAPKRLREKAPRAKQPSTADIGKVYAIARSARYPRQTLDGHRYYDRKCEDGGCWRTWTADDRERFWKTLLFLMAKTGLSICDFRELKWSDVGCDRLEWPTGKGRCGLDITAQVKKHLDLVRGLDPTYPLPIAKWSVRFIRRELNRLRKLAGVRGRRRLSEAQLPKVYPFAGAAAFPKMTFNGDTVGCRRKWTDDERERFWRAFLFLGYWTGLRIKDLRSLEWSHVFADRIEWEASKTGAQHVFPVTADVQRHLEMARGLDPVYVFPIPPGSVYKVREEMRYLCDLAGVEPFLPQMVRRASVTEWSCTAAPDAGALIHGCGLGIRRYYVNPLKVLSRASATFELPKEMRDPTRNESNGHEVPQLLANLSADELATLVRLAKAFSQKGSEVLQ